MSWLITEYTHRDMFQEHLWIFALKFIIELWIVQIILKYIRKEKKHSKCFAFKYLGNTEKIFYKWKYLERKFRTLKSLKEVCTLQLNCILYLKYFKCHLRNGIENYLAIISVKLYYIANRLQSMWELQNKILFWNSIHTLQKYFEMRIILEIYILETI
jgi:hypothetical protein